MCVRQSRASEALRALRQARFICDMLDRTGVTTAPCEVGSRTITLHAILEVGQARDICTTMVNRTRDPHYAFNGEWKLEIRTPF